MQRIGDFGTEATAGPIIAPATDVCVGRRAPRAGACARPPVMAPREAAHRAGTDPFHSSLRCNHFSSACSFVLTLVVVLPRFSQGHRCLSCGAGPSPTLAGSS